MQSPDGMLERERRNFSSFTASLSKVLTEKGIFNIEDVKKFIEYQNDYMEKHKEVE